MLHYDDTEVALRFLTDAVGFRAVVVARDDAGRIVHCELRWPEGDRVLFGSAAHTDSVHDSMRPGTAAMYVPDRRVAGVHRRVVAAGILSPLGETTFGSGDRAIAFTLKDTEGDLWTFGDHHGGRE